MMNYHLFVSSFCASQYSQEFTCSVVLGKDLVPRLGLHTMEDLKAQLLTAIHDCDTPKVSRDVYLKHILVAIHLKSAWYF